MDSEKKAVGSRLWAVGALLLCLLSTTYSLQTESQRSLPAEPSFLSGKDKAVWVSSRSAIFGKTPGGAKVKTITLGEGFEVLGEEGTYLKAKSSSGSVGWLKKSDTSSVWILLEKSKRRLTFFDQRTPLDDWGADLGPEPKGDKEKQGDGKTPEGEFYVCRKIPNSQFYKAFLVSYPSIQHAERGLKNGWITPAQHASIVKAIKTRNVPPQNTRLGGYIEIHGSGTGGFYDWTLGCAGMPNKAMDFMWDKTPVGTPIVIIP